MKVIGVLGVLALGGAALLTSCTKSSMEYHGKGFPETEEYVYLYDAENPSSTPLDSTKIVNGEFLFDGEKIKTGLYFITVKGMDRYLVDFAENNCEIAYDEATKGIKVKGSPYDELLNSYYALRGENRKVVQECEEEAQKYPRNEEEMTEEQKNAYEALIKRYYASNDKFTDGLKKLAFDNPSAPLSFVFLATLLDDLNDEDLQKAKEMISNYKGADFVALKRCREFFEIREATATGKPFRDFEVLNQEGARSSLSNVAGKGQVVLVDFWASWCGYCKRAFPELKELYKEFAPKGFEIFGYSIDKDKSKWKAQIEIEGLQWPQFVTDESIQAKGENLYGVRGIPFTVLIDKDGAILGTNLAMDELRAKLAEKLQ